MIQAFLVPIVVCGLIFKFGFKFLVLRVSISIQNASFWTTSEDSSFCYYWFRVESPRRPDYRLLKFKEIFSKFVFEDLQKPPKYWCIFPFVGFGTGMLWIYIEANEILNILTALGKRRDSRIQIES